MTALYPSLRRAVRALPPPIRPLVSRFSTNKGSDLGGKFQEGGEEQREKIDFQDGAQAYKDISTAALMRALGVFSVCGLQIVVRNSHRILQTALKLFGPTVVQVIMRRTLFAHFCGGEDLESIRPTIARLRESNIGGILDFAAEADIEGEGEGVTLHHVTGEVSKPIEEISQGEVVPQPTTVQGNALARQYSYHTERQCDANKKIFETAIRAVHGVSPGGFAAIKVTALGNPLLLERWSTALREIHRLFDIMDVDSDEGVHFEEFMSSWKKLFVPLEESEVRKIFSDFDKNNTGKIDPVEWMSTLDPPKMRQLASSCLEKGPFATAVLDDEEEKLLLAMQTRLKSLVKLADDLDVRLMVDAEHTYLQPAIDNLVLGVQRRYNRRIDRVYGTIQCYLKDAQYRNRIMMQTAEQEGWVYAVKLVRGAYMHQEKERAMKLNYPDPIHNSLQDTHECYHSVMSDVVARESVKNGSQKANLVVASHNQRSVEHAIDLIHRAGLRPSESGVAFGQLLGMADHLTYSLGHHGYLVYKYVPYGPILETLPYLVRRAQENSDLMGSVGYEMRMLRAEIRRRLFPWFT
ncbi:hypothetical protein AAMO2058_000025000 [Amorphochlora amoebiformis]